MTSKCPECLHFLIDFTYCLQFNDDQLQFSRLDFVKLAQFDEVAELERCGYAYAERMDLQGAFDSYLGTVRKGVVRRVIEYPVRQLSRALASVDLA